MPEVDNACPARIGSSERAGKGYCRPMGQGAASALRPLASVFFGILLISGLGGVIGGAVRVVIGVVEGDWSKVVISFVGMLTGAVFLGVAEGIRPNRERRPTP
jgi:hypothetical protein